MGWGGGQIQLSCIISEEEERVEEGGGWYLDCDFLKIMTVTEAKNTT